MEAQQGDEHGAGLAEQGQGDQHGGSLEIQVTVDYLPAAQPFHASYPATTAVETVRAAAMAFFEVRDRTERDAYAYFLEFEGNRVTNTGQTLEQLLGPHRKGAHFHLVEQITPGMVTT